MVAVDNVGNLKSAAYGAVSSDVLPGQTSRDGEDYAAAMAGHITVDPLTLHIGCEGTIATISGPKCVALGAGGRRAHVWSRPLGSHDEVRAIKVKGHATQRDVEAGPLAKQAARWAAEAHVMLRSRGWNDTQAAAPRPRVRPPRAKTKRKRREVAALPATGQASDWLSSWRTSQLRKFRSGLSPNKRYPGWTVEDVRRPSLAEATTLVVQLESCEAGLGRTVMRPTTFQKQRAALEHWERNFGIAKTGDLALQRWDKGRPAAYGLNDQLVSKLFLKAEV